MAAERKRSGKDRKRRVAREFAERNRREDEKGKRGG